jgi:hypothetical protein
MEKLALFGIISIVVISFLAVVMTSAIESSTANAAFNFYDYELGASSYAGPKVYGGNAKKLSAPRPLSKVDVDDVKLMDAYYPLFMKNWDKCDFSLSETSALSSDMPCLKDEQSGKYCCLRQ